MRLIFCLLLLVLSSDAVLAARYNFVVIIDTTQGLYADKQLRGGKTYAFKAEHFGQSFKILEEYISRDKRTYQIKVDDTTGWVSKDFVLANERNKKRIFALKDKQNDSRLTRKVIVVNKLEAEKFPQSLPLYSNSRLTGEPIGRTTIFELRYLFMENKLAKTVLIGKSDRFSNKHSVRILSGWIATKHIEEWNNRIGIEFDKSNFSNRDRGVIFEMNKRKSTRKPMVMYKEEDDANAMAYYVNRFPVLAKKEIEGTDNIHYKVAYIGGAQGDSGEIYSQEEIAQAKDTVSKVALNTHLQIAILIDSTLGMQHHMPSVKEALSQFLLRVKESDKNNIKIDVALATYRDWTDGETVYSIASDFTSDYGSITAQINTLQAGSSKNDKGVGAYPEALFSGIIRTANDLQWSPAADHYLILIGDHGNHEETSQYPQEAEFSKEKVRQQLKNKHIALYAIQVNINNPNRTEVISRFRRQIKFIVGDNNPFGRLDMIDGNSAYEIKNALDKAYESFYTTKLAMSDVRQDREIKEVALKSANTNNPADSEPETNLGTVYKGRFTQMVLERYNIDPKIFNAVQVCAVGYTTKFDRDENNQVIEKVLMTKLLVERLKLLVNDLAAEIYSNSGEDDDLLRKAFINIVKALTGDKPSPDVSISEFVHKKVGLPIQTDFLQQSINDLIVMINDDDTKMELVRYLRDKQLKLEEVVKEQQIIATDWDSDSGTYQYREGKEIAYFFSLEQPLLERIKKKGETAIASNKTHVWLPFDYLP